MAVRIRFDNTHNAIQPTLILATRNGDKLGVMPTGGVHISDHMESCTELQFAVYKEINGVRCPIWDDIQDFKLAWSPEWDIWFEINVEINEQDETIKNVSAKTVGEAELSQINLYGIEINTETDIARSDYVPTVIYNPNNTGASLLHRILGKAPHYSIGHVDETLASIQRTFQFDGTTILDALNAVASEIDCYVQIDSSSNSDGSIARKISLYDLCTVCMNCGERGRFSDKCPECGSTNLSEGYGEDTNVFVSVENLAEDVTYQSDADSVKNCFRLVGGDDLMTATIKNCNPNGSEYIWHITEDMRKDMSTDLVSKLSQYDARYNYYNKEYNAPIDAATCTAYNTLVAKYLPYKSDLRQITTPVIGFSNLITSYYDTVDFELFLRSALMPAGSIETTDAATEAAKLTSAALSPVSVTSLTSLSAATAANAVLSMARVIVDQRFQVKVKTSALSGTTWTGSFTVTSYSDTEDTADSANVSVVINNDYENFVRQKLERAMSDKSDDVTDIAALFDLTLAEFRDEIEKYALNMLTGFNEACLACMNIMIEQGISDSENDLYQTMYVPYYNKQVALQAEIKLREQEIATIAGTTDENGLTVTNGMRTYIVKNIQAVQSALDLEAFLGTGLMKELAAYRREDQYENSNYISDGLNNAELIESAMAFLKVARQELYKSSTLQHSITSTLKNLLVMKEFEPLVEHFNIGNWLRVRVDGNVYKLRLIGYEIDYDNLEALSVEFSDVERTMDGVTDIENILSKAASMATSYNAVTRQSNSGKKANAWLENWVEKGLSLTQMKILDDARMQNIQIDDLGLLCRQYSQITDDYDDKQLRIINRGMYLTDDGWETSRTGVGDFYYYDPSDGQTKQAYGVIADMLVGNMILTKDVGVYNEDGTIKLDKNGFTLISTGNGSTDTVFRIQSRQTQGGSTTTKDVIYFDNNGDAHFDGKLSANCISGGTLTLGGNNNTNGVMQVLNASGNAVVTLNKDGANISEGNIVSYTEGKTRRVSLDAGELHYEGYLASTSDSNLDWRTLLKIEPRTLSQYVENCMTQLYSDGSLYLGAGYQKSIYLSIVAEQTQSAVKLYQVVVAADGIHIGGPLHVSDGTNNGTGQSGTFTTADGKTVTLLNGVATDVSSATPAVQPVSALSGVGVVRGGYIKTGRTVTFTVNLTLGSPSATELLSALYGFPAPLYRCGFEIESDTASSVSLFRRAKINTSGVMALIGAFETNETITITGSYISAS